MDTLNLYIKARLGIWCFFNFLVKLHCEFTDYLWHYYGTDNQWLSTDSDLERREVDNSPKLLYNNDL